MNGNAPVEAWVRIQNDNIVRPFANAKFTASFLYFIGISSTFSAKIINIILNFQLPDRVTCVTVMPTVNFGLQTVIATFLFRICLEDASVMPRSNRYQTLFQLLENLVWTICLLAGRLVCPIRFPKQTHHFTASQARSDDGTERGWNQPNSSFRH